MTGPTTIAPVVNDVHVPIAFACAAPENVEVMSARELGTRNAPAAPCTSRAMTRISGSGARAIATEATPNPTSPIRSTSARPKASLTDPASSIRAPSVIR